VFIVVSVYFVIGSVWKLLDTPSYLQIVVFMVRITTAVVMASAFSHAEE